MLSPLLYVKLLCGQPESHPNLEKKQTKSRDKTNRLAGQKQ